MPQSRIKPSAVLSDFLSAVGRFERFDAENQSRFSTTSSASPSMGISKTQLHFLTEAIFFSTYREFENFIRDIFLLYSQEKSHSSSKKVVSYLRPNSFLHAERLIQSSMPFLDWSSADNVIARSELYLKDGFPIKLPYTSNLESLRDFRKIRNHIAHNSSKSMDDYKKVIKKHYGIIPLRIPPPGEFLLVSKRGSSGKYMLLIFFDTLKKIASDFV
jgi:hypothetical protein